MLVLSGSIANQLFKGYLAQLISTRSIPNWGPFQVKNLHMTQKNEIFQILCRFQWDIERSYFHVDPFQIEVHSKSKICIRHKKMKFLKFCVDFNGIYSEAIFMLIHSKLRSIPSQKFAYDTKKCNFSNFAWHAMGSLAKLFESLAKHFQVVSGFKLWTTDGNKF